MGAPSGETKLQQLWTTMLATRELDPQRLHQKTEKLHDKLDGSAASGRTSGSCGCEAASRGEQQGLLQEIPGSSKHCIA